MKPRRIEYRTPDGRNMFIDLELNGIAIGFEGCGTKEDAGAAPI